MTRRVLLVAGLHDPDESVDNSRVRDLVARIGEHGWQPNVIAIARDGHSESDYAVEPHVRRVRMLPRLPGIGSIALRAYFAMAQAVEQWHLEKPFDAALFSNTAFPLWRLAPRWRRRLGLRYVLDWQDPWLTDFYERHPDITPPGGRIKFRLNMALARRGESRVVAEANGHIAVSSAYLRTLESRYGPASTQNAEVVPFGFEPSELERASRLKKHWLLPEPARRNWVYAGRGGDDMAFACRVVFGALVAARRTNPGILDGLRLHFVGTDYAMDSRARATIAPIAAAFGLQDFVREYPARIPRADALRLLLDADALIVPGSNDPEYSASKVYACLYAMKPTLSIFHARSDVQQVMAGQPGTVALSFDSESASEFERLAEEASERFVLSGLHATRVVSPRRLDDLTSASMVRRVASVLDAAVAR